MSASSVGLGHNQHMLACPVCQQPLTQQQRQFVCEANHSFDLAKQGYLNLLLVNQKRSKTPGDSADMIQARQRFLDQGYYQPIAEQLNQSVLSALSGKPPENGWQLADVGCGDGYYSTRLSQALALRQEHRQEQKHQLYGVDISKDALKAACKRTRSASTSTSTTENNIQWLVASGRRLPMLPHSLDAIVSLFTPVTPEGWHQTLKPGGKLILATTGQDHLLELRQKIYPDVSTRVFDPRPELENHHFRALEEPTRLQASATIQASDLPDLLTMTPHGWRSSPTTHEALFALPQLTVTLDVNFWLFEATGAASAESAP